MNTCTKKHNLSKLILEYIVLLVKSENLHNKLEELCLNATNKTSAFINNQIIRLNNALNKVFVDLMKLQWIIELVAI